MSRRLPPRKRQRFKTAYHRARNQVYKQARLEVQRAFRHERALILTTIRDSPTVEDARAAVKEVLDEVHKAAQWEARLKRMHIGAATEGATVTLNVLGPPQKKSELKFWERVTEPIRGFFHRIAGVFRGSEARSVESITTTTDELLTKVLDNAVASNLTPEQLAGDVETLFNGWEDTRAEMIGVTETTKAFGAGSLDVVTELALAKYKVWCTMGDDRVRPWHEEAEGQTVPVDEPFIVMEEEVMEPGDGSSENSDNCRCWADYVDEPG